LVSASLPVLLSEIVKLSTSGLLLDAAFLTIKDSQDMALAQSFKDSNKYCNGEGDNMTMSVAPQERDEREEDIVLRSEHD
jgi:hypothetical protein